MRGQENQRFWLYTSYCMIYDPQNYAIEDKAMVPFISEKEIYDILDAAIPTRDRVREVIAKSLDKKRLTLQETAILVKAEDPDLVQEIKEGARLLKEKIYLVDLLNHIRHLLLLNLQLL